MPSPPELFAIAVTTVDSGGPVMPWILLLSTLMWSVIMRRCLRLRRMHRASLHPPAPYGPAPQTRNPRVAQRLRAAAAADRRFHACRDAALLRAIVVALPLLGLLGTVAGLVQTFDVVTFFGMAHRQAFSGGLSAALIATFTGLMSAIAGLCCASLLEAHARRLPIASPLALQPPPDGID